MIIFTKVYQAIIPQFPSHMFTDEANYVAEVFKCPHYFSNSKMKDSLKIIEEPKKDNAIEVYRSGKSKVSSSGESLSNILATSSKPEEGHAESWFNVNIDVAGMQAYIEDGDVVDAYVKSYSASFHVYIVVKDGCKGFKGANGHEYVERRLEMLCNFLFKEINRQKLYVYLIPESRDKQTGGYRD